MFVTRNIYEENINIYKENRDKNPSKENRKKL